MGRTGRDSSPLTPLPGAGSRRAPRFGLTSGAALVCLCCHAQAPSAAPAPSAAQAPAATQRSAPGGAPIAKEAPLEASPVEIEIGASRLHVFFDPGAFDVGDAALLAWITTAARAIESYYGRFPVSDLRIELRAVEGRGLRGGRAMPTTPASITIGVGKHASQRLLDRNWTMTHEMVHLALPNLPRAHHWLEEGLATYVEPIARARAGSLPEEAVWREWIENFPHGLPEPGDRGLDHTPTWGRTYWGGAIFCFVADLEIRKATQNRLELRDALRAIVAKGGNITERWSIERVFAKGDEATRTSVLADLYREMKDTPKAPDLDPIWRQLGISLKAGAIRYDDAAPLAAIRRSFVLGR